MNFDDVAAIAKEIYIRRIVEKHDWDQQKIARESIESAKQFVQALHYEKEGIAYSTYVAPETLPQVELPKGSILTQMKQNLAAQSQGSHTKTDNPPDVGTSMAQQHHLGQSG